MAHIPSFQEEELFKEYENTEFKNRFLLDGRLLERSEAFRKSGGEFNFTGQIPVSDPLAAEGQIRNFARKGSIFEHSTLFATDKDKKVTRPQVETGKDKTVQVSNSSVRREK